MRDSKVSQHQGQCSQNCAGNMGIYVMLDVALIVLYYIINWCWKLIWRRKITPFNFCDSWTGTSISACRGKARLLIHNVTVSGTQRGAHCFKRERDALMWLATTRASPHRTHWKLILLIRAILQLRVLDMLTGATHQTCVRDSIMNEDTARNASPLRQTGVSAGFDCPS